MSVEENVPLGTFQSNCKLTITTLSENVQDCGIKFLSPLPPHKENLPSFNNVTII